MGRKKLEERLFSDFDPLVSERGLSLIDVRVSSGPENTVLCATIYRPEGVSFDDCVAVQNVLSDHLDRTDPFPGSFTLEVSSPGLQRTLRNDVEFSVFKGALCRVNLFAPSGGKRTFLGRLNGLFQGEKEKVVSIETENGDCVFPRSNVSKVQLVYEPRAN